MIDTKKKIFGVSIVGLAIVAVIFAAIMVSYDVSQQGTFLAFTDPWGVVEVVVEHPDTGVEQAGLVCVIKKTGSEYVDRSVYLYPENSEFHQVTAERGSVTSARFRRPDDDNRQIIGTCYCSGTESSSGYVDFSSNVYMGTTVKKTVELDCVGGGGGEDLCSDSDSGINIYVKGTATDETMTRTDNCWGDFAVYEYYCNGDVVDMVIRDCETGYACNNGACVRTAITTTTTMAGVTTTTLAGVTTTTSTTTTTLPVVAPSVDWVTVVLALVAIALALFMLLVIALGIVWYVKRRK